MYILTYSNTQVHATACNQNSSYFKISTYLNSELNSGCANATVVEYRPRYRPRR